MGNDVKTDSSYRRQRQKQKRFINLSPVSRARPLGGPVSHSLRYGLHSCAIFDGFKYGIHFSKTGAETAGVCL
jgi:hypothetical protein